MRDLRRVFHVGFLDEKNPAVVRPAGSSLEGNGLSVSVHPVTWMQLARLGGGETFALENDNPKFFNAHDKGLREEALKWCLDTGFVAKKKYWKSIHTDEYGDEYFFSHDSPEEALAEVDEDPSRVEVAQGFVVTDLMIGYFKSEKSPSPFLVEEYAILWYAEAAGFDGVWWEDEFDSTRLSAPRGVIFQHKLDSWRIIRNAGSDDPSDL